MQKKSFTLLEMTIVVALLWLIFAISKSFFNISRQEKLVFWETCVNYIFGEFSKFESDIKYGKNIYAYVSWTALTPTSYIIWVYDSWLSLSWVAAITGWVWVAAYNTSSGLFAIYKTYNISTDSAIRPVQCVNNKYLLTTNSTPYAKMNYIYTANGDSYISNTVSWASIQPYTGESIFHVCDIVVLWSWATSTRSQVKSCIQVAKVYFDRRIGTMQFLKCMKINDQSGICGLWPVVN